MQLNFSLQLYFQVLIVFCGLLWSFTLLSLLDMNLFLTVILIGWSSSKSLQFSFGMFDLNCPALINKRNDELKKLGSRIFILPGFDVNVLGVIRPIFSKADVSKSTAKLRARTRECTQICTS